MTSETSHPHYFTVVDAIGWPSPAMEYWAAVPDEEQPTTNAPMPMRRFIRLIGSGEGLIETGKGVFLGRETQRSFYRFQTTEH